MKKMVLFIALFKKEKSMRGTKPLSHQEGVMSHKYKFSLQKCDILELPGHSVPACTTLVNACS